mmetsp:Transcript_34590/g.99633  ORF Transcript_34590/g.99633 Transcript_34590/m.99633 type:complete len:205 (-) Transcript_34590:92-706(-)
MRMAMKTVPTMAPSSPSPCVTAFSTSSKTRLPPSSISIPRSLASVKSLEHVSAPMRLFCKSTYSRLLDALLDSSSATAFPPSSPKFAENNLREVTVCEASMASASQRMPSGPTAWKERSKARMQLAGCCNTCASDNMLVGPSRPAASVSDRMQCRCSPSLVSSRRTKARMSKLEKRSLSPVQSRAKSGLPYSNCVSRSAAGGTP